MEKMTRFHGSDFLDLEVEIQRELDALGNDDNFEVDNNFDEGDEIFLDSGLQESEDFIPESLQEYIRVVQSRAECVEEEVQDCDVLLRGLQTDGRSDDEKIAAKVKEQLGQDFLGNPLELRNQVLIELEEAEKRENEMKKEKVEENEMAIDVLRPDVLEEVRVLELEAEKKLKDLEQKQAMKEQLRRETYDKMKKEEERRKQAEGEERLKRQRELVDEQKRQEETQKALQVKHQEEVREREKKLESIQQQFQVDLKALENEKHRETVAFQEMQAKEKKYQEEKRNAAVIMIQKHYRGYRTYKKYNKVLEQRRIERIRQRKEELDRIEQMEQKIREEKEAAKAKEEEDKRRKAAEEKKMQEELKRRQEEELLKKKREEERRLKELEEKRKKEEKRKQEEEEKKKIAEERKKIEEENKSKEEEERKKRILEEEKRKKEMEEKKKIDEEERKQNELERKLEEEEKERRKRAEEEKQKREEEKKQKEEEKRHMEEKRKKELEDKVKRKKEEEAKQRKMEIEKEKKRMETLLKEGRDLHSGLFLHLEEMRQEWLKEHIPWSESTNEERIQPIARAKIRRPFSSSKKLPHLTEEQLTRISAQGTPLEKVKAVYLEDLPGCTMQGLNKCPSLRSLTLHHCGLVAVEGIDNCQELVELQVQDNKIESLNCRELSSLTEIILSDNNLTSLQGLVGCSNLRLLDLSKNKITRIGDLSSCPKLQSLSLDQNQLIMAKGLSKLKYLQNLSFRHNHLSHIKEIGDCSLLQILNLQSNNLQEPPQLRNHVLLRELWLDDNSITSLASLSSSWLPLLQVLSVGQNSISSLDPLNGFIMLDTIDIRNNLLSDVESVVNGLRGCDWLRTLITEGNPVTEEPEYRETVLKTLPNLVTLDTVKVENQHVKDEPIPNTLPFYTMCKKQLLHQDDIQRTFRNELRKLEGNKNTQIIIARLEKKIEYFEKCYQLAVSHLREHEKFDPQLYMNSSIKLSSVPEEKRDSQSSTPPVSQGYNLQLHSLSVTKQSNRDEKDEEKHRHVAATKIQALWRGWNFRNQIEIQTAKWMAAVTIQSVWRGYWTRSRLIKYGILNERKPFWNELHHRSAILIQAYYRGYRVRRHLSRALKSVHELNYLGDDDFNYDEEVDLDDFDFDESALEDGWTPAKTPQLPSRGPALKVPPSMLDTMGMCGNSVINQDVKYSNSGWQPKQAWQSADSPIVSQKKAPEVLQIFRDQDAVSTMSGTHSHLSHRAEELSSEWGFQNAATAELMMKRAKRMKYDAVRKKKMLDPTKRLALFRKLEETNKLRDVRPPPRRQKQPSKIEYFAARQSRTWSRESFSPTSEQEAKAQMTYSWVYKQAVIHEDEQDIMSGRKDYVQERHQSKQPFEKRRDNFQHQYQSKAAFEKVGRDRNQSPVNLPHIDPKILTGRHGPLVSSPLALRSVDELSQYSDSVTVERRHSLSSDSRLRFPPIKTHSVPNLKARSLLGAISGGSQEKKSNSAGARMGKDRKHRK